jgi:phosphatidylserine decarboxylase
MIAPDGLKIILITTLILVLLVILTLLFPVLWLRIITAGVALIFLFNFYFFRDPQRSIPTGDDLILSPADGKVVLIEEVEETEFLKEKVTRVSIFLSVFDVHVNRVPVTGMVSYLKYLEGKFFVAFADKASEENEQSIIGIEHARGKVLFKQIAGIIARRIVYHLNIGDQVSAGQRFGLIRYGSRVDVYFPKNTTIRVKLNDMVTGGETVLGEFN